MSCEEISLDFKIEILIKDVTVKIIGDVASSEDELKIDLGFLGRKIEAEGENQVSIPFVDGFHSVDLSFELKNDFENIINEEFMFKAFGSYVSCKFFGFLNFQFNFDKFSSEHFKANSGRKKSCG